MNTEDTGNTTHSSSIPDGASTITKSSTDEDPSNVSSVEKEEKIIQTTTICKTAKEETSAATPTTTTDIVTDKKCHPSSSSSCEDWSGGILFRATENLFTFKELDITKYIGDQRYKDKKTGFATRIYFDINDYPVEEEFFNISSCETMIANDNNGDKSKYTDKEVRTTLTKARYKSESFKKLALDIRAAAFMCGVNLIQNGNQGQESKDGFLVRSRFTCQNYRSKTLPNPNGKRTRRSSPTDGRPLPKKPTMRRCKHFFYVSFDRNGFYVVPGLGFKKHTNHLPIEPHCISKKEIQICFDSWTKAWNEGNTEAYLKAYADLPSIRYVSGTNITIGKENIVKLITSRGGAKGILSIHPPFTIEILPNHNDAICFGQYELELPNDNDTTTPAAKQNGCFTTHLRKIEGSWKILSDHSS